MSNPKLSLIIPVYNGELYIQASLDAILCQSNAEVEVIVVDDGSTDATVNLIHQHFISAIETAKLSLYSQENQGVSAARNVGIEHARGDYIGFVDVDDLVLPDYMEILLNTLPGSDIIEFGFKRFVDSAHETVGGRPLYSNNQFGQHDVSNVLDNVYITARWYPWTRVFKKKLFNGVRFPVEVRFCEDLMTIPLLYEKAQTIVVLENAIYGYRSNLNSATFIVKSDYVEKLKSFYKTIPNSGLLRHDYLKLSIAYAIFSCQEKLKKTWEMPHEIQQDISRLRFKASIYTKIGMRRSLILFYPSIFNFLRKWLR